jgi:nifR3 family TIM-barrel protein
MNFWHQLDKPILALAPMAGVTDSAFRRICRLAGADVVYSEMASVSGLFHSNRDKTLKLLRFTEEERPYVVQLFGSEPEHFAYAAKLVTHEIGPDGIDINFGCPVPKVTRQKAGAELMKDIDQSQRVIEAVMKATDLPVSIKTRVMCGKVGILEFLEHISNLPVSALMLHGRSLAQGFAGEADFSLVREARDYFNGIIMVNGGINTDEDALRAIEISSADGLGLARGAMGNPWLFTRLRQVFGLDHPGENLGSLSETILMHARLMLEDKGEQGIVEMRKHLCWYLKGLPQAAELRGQAVHIKIFKDIENLLNRFTH